jgi:flavin reductase (DIM6/NTAB) family NADH-FMN oxidoreductase RutF
LKRSLGPRTYLYPTPALALGTYSADGRPNAMAAAWSGVTCSEPPCVLVAVRPATLTYHNLLRERAFSLGVPREDQVRELDFLGLCSGRERDKLAELGWTTHPGAHVHAPILEACPLVLECQVRQVLELGSHTQFVGEVLDALLDEELLTPDGKPDVERLRPIAYAPVNRVYFGLGPRLGKAFSVGKR